MPGGLESDEESSPFGFSVIIPNSVLNALLIPICIAGNVLVLAAVWRNPSLRTPSTILLCSLAVSDLFVGFLVLPVYVAIARFILSGSSSYSRLSQASVVLLIQLCCVSLQKQWQPSAWIDIWPYDITCDIRIWWPLNVQCTLQQHFGVKTSFYHCLSFGRKLLFFLLHLSFLPYVFSLLQLLTVQFIESFDTINIRFTPNSKPYRVWMRNKTASYKRRNAL